jgi:hypothetical protein
MDKVWNGKGLQRGPRSYGLMIAVHDDESQQECSRWVETLDEKPTVVMADLLLRLDDCCEAPPTEECA